MSVLSQETSLGPVIISSVMGRKQWQLHELRKVNVNVLYTFLKLRKLIENSVYLSQVREINVNVLHFFLKLGTFMWAWCIPSESYES
jgi:hypothetical protein